MTEEEKRLHRCCFTGHRPEKLNATEEEVKLWLEKQIDQAIADGYLTFISGCAMGVDIWAGQIVLRKKADNPKIHLICATPWQGFARRWNEEWQNQFQQRNVWMVDRSNRLIAYYNGASGGTRNTIEYAEKKGIECCVLKQEL